jgi:hypothetical protein
MEVHVMRFRPSIAQSFRRVLCLAAVGALPKSGLAQDFVAPVVPIGSPVPDPPCLSYSFWHHRPVFPRTYSYQYDIWLNRPRHTRVAGPDGCVYWQTSVRGLPLGTPWPGP